MLASQVEEAAATISAILSLAEDKINNSLENFIDKELSPVLGPSIGRYYQLFTALDITSRADLELLFKTHFHHQKVQDAYEELTSVEETWNSFLQQLDSQVQKTNAGPALQEGELFPLHTKVFNIGNEELSVAQLIPAAGHLHLVLLRHFA